MDARVRPCEQFGAVRAAQIEALCEAALGLPCPVRMGGVCPFAMIRVVPDLPVCIEQVPPAVAAGLI